MIAPRAYFAPTSIADAVALLAERPQAHLLAGGTDLLNDLRHGVIEPDDVIDLAGIAELRGFDIDAEGVRIGSMVTIRDLLAAPLNGRITALLEAADLLGGRQIQAAATVGGNVCQGSPAAEVDTALLAHDAVAHITGPAGERSTPIAEIFVGPRRTTLSPDEVLVGFQVRADRARWRSAYRRIDLRRSVDIAIVSTSVALDVHDGVVRDARVAIGAARPTPFVSAAAAAELIGASLDGIAEAAERAARAAAADSKPITDVRASADYRQAMVEVVVRRAILAAAERNEDLA